MAGMSPTCRADELDDEIAAGVTFWGHEVDGILVGLMGMQSGCWTSISSATLTSCLALKRRAIGGALLLHLQHLSTRPMLVVNLGRCGVGNSFL